MSSHCRRRLHRVCDVTCDVTLASKPVQVAAKGYLQSSLTSRMRCARWLNSCILNSLPLTRSSWDL
jgi:hypothetical protein